MTQPQPPNPMNNVSARLLQVAGQVVDLLVARQHLGTKIHANDIAAQLATTNVTAQEVGNVVRWIRLNYPEIPLLSSRDGYEMSAAWRPNLEFYLWRFRIILTYMRVTRRGAVQPLLRLHAQNPRLTNDQLSLLNQVDAALQFTGVTLENIVHQFEADLGVLSNGTHP